MPIDEEPSGPVKGPILGAARDLDKAPPPCFNVEESLAVDHEARQKRREVKELEDAFDPEFDELPDAWNWED